MSAAVFTNRDIEVVMIETVHDDGRTVTWTNGWSFGGIPSEHVGHLVVGAQFLLETQQFSIITGMATIYFANNGEAVVTDWLWHKTDAELDAEHAEMVAGFKREREERLAANRETWAAREALLPDALRRRLERFRANGEDEFDVNGWGYELTICELAALYAESEQTDSDAVNEFARTHGTSGNQHAYAKALSRLLTGEAVDEDLAANSVSALAPLTGDADYSGAKS